MHQTHWKQEKRVWMKKRIPVYRPALDMRAEEGDLKFLFTVFEQLQRMHNSEAAVNYGNTAKRKL